jgi:hypothetical protein
MKEAKSMSEKKRPTAKVVVSKKTTKDLKLKPGRGEQVKGGIGGSFLPSRR